MVQGDGEQWSRLVSNLRRRRSLILAQGSSAAKSPGNDPKPPINPERVRRLANPFRVHIRLNISIPGLSLRSNRWAGISERRWRYQM